MHSSLMRNLKVILYQIQENNGFRDDSCLPQSQLTQRWVTEIKIISKKNCEVNEDCTMSRYHVYATLPVLPTLLYSVSGFWAPACYSLPPAGRGSMTNPLSLWRHYRKWYLHLIFKINSRFYTINFELTGVEPETSWKVDVSLQDNSVIIKIICISCYIVYLAYVSRKMDSFLPFLLQLALA